MKRSTFIFAAAIAVAAFFHIQTNAQVLKADYRFEGNLESSVAGAPALTNLTGTNGSNSFAVDTVDGYNRQTLRFPLNNGVGLAGLGSVVPQNAFTVVILFKFDDMSASRRLFDVSGGTVADNGGFMLNGRFEPEPTTNLATMSNTYVQIVLVRTGTGQVIGYRDGFQRITDPDDGTVLTAGIRFFQDYVNNPVLASAGNIARLRFYDAPMTAQQVQMLDRVPEAPLGAHPIIFFSNRNGVLQNFRMNADGSGHVRIAPTTAAAFAGKFSPNGQRIVYQSRPTPTDPQQIWIVNADGTNPVQLTTGTESNISASWRPDGQRILFSRCNLPVCDLWTMNPDGSGQQPITAANTSGDEDQARFTPDGTKLVFPCSDANITNYQICVTNADGTNRQVITNTAAPLVSQLIDISPNGQKLVFVRNSTTINGTPGEDIYTMDINGANLVNITNNATRDTTPIWSPDGTKIMFSAARAGGINDIWLMNADGSNPIRLMRNSFDDRMSDWYRPPRKSTQFDFDGDSKTDVSIFRPGPGEWWYLRSSDGGNRAYQFGSSADVLTPSDYTGDGKTDVALFRPSTGEWFILRSEDGSFYSFAFGTSGDIPVPADFDGDGRSDAAIFRPSTSTWFIFRSSDNGTTIASFGTAGDRPVPADLDGDAKADLAIYRPGPGEWWYLRSSDGANRAFTFGQSTDKALPADFTSDGKADIAFFRPSSGEWFVLRSENSSFYSFPFGTASDIPAPGDYDGDGRTDAAVFRPATSTWFANGSTSGTLITTFGAAGDQPIPNAFVR